MYSYNSWELKHLGLASIDVRKWRRAFFRWFFSDCPELFLRLATVNTFRQCLERTFLVSGKVLKREQNLSVCGDFPSYFSLFDRGAASWRSQSDMPSYNIEYNPQWWLNKDKTYQKSSHRGYCPMYQVRKSEVSEQTEISWNETSRIWRERFKLSLSGVYPSGLYREWAQERCLPGRNWDRR